MADLLSLGRQTALMAPMAPHGRQTAPLVAPPMQANGPRVLLLNLADESASGANLTLCNHAIFVHPMLADSQEHYTACETQVRSD